MIQAAIVSQEEEEVGQNRDKDGCKDSKKKQTSMRHTASTATIE